VKTKLKYGNWLATSGMAVLTIAWLLVFFLPGLKASREMRNDIEAKQVLISQAELLSMQFQSGQAEQRETAGFVESRREPMPSPAEVSDLFGRIAGLAGESGPKVTRFEPAAAVEYDTLTRIPLELGCQADLQGAWRFLEALESLPSPVWIEKLKLEAKSEDRQTLQCDINLAVFADKSGLSD
jgi:Tfp pilus assembly protein PilO